MSVNPVYRVLGREVLACLAWGAFYPLGIKKSEKRTPRVETQRTVVFVHGYLGNRASFYPLATYLRTTGVKQFLYFDYSSSGGIERSARELKTFLRDNVRGGRIDLVCHSLGGVIAQLYVQELGGYRRVDRCINLGTPDRGTYNSYWITSRVGRELRPESALMKRLQAKRGKVGRVKVTAIVGASDNIVLPRAQPVEGEDIVQVAEVGHVGLLFTPTVFFEVAKRLHAPLQ